MGLFILKDIIATFPTDVIFNLSEQNMFPFLSSLLFKKPNGV